MARKLRRYKPKPKKRRRKRPAAAGGGSVRGGGGVMTSMVRGFRRAVGVERKAESSGGRDWLWTVLLVLVAAALVFWKFRP